MRSCQGCRLLLPATLLLVAMTIFALAAAAKGQKVTCKGNKVPVTVGGKTTCKPLAKAIPKPKAIDIRLAYLQESLKRGAPKSGGKKKKRFRSLQSGFGAAGKRAQRRFLKALPKALALLDRRAGGKAGASSLPPGPAMASACSANGPVEPMGNVAGVGVAAAGENGGQMTINSAGLTFRTRFAKCGGGGGFGVPECPAANGEVSASGNSNFEVTEEVLEGERVVSRRNTSIEAKSKARGKVAADAKLDYIIVNSAEATFIVASGGLVQRGTAEREVKVNMRSGKYDPAGAKVKYSGDARPNDGESSFASVVQNAIEAFRVGEVGGSFLRDDGWATFNRKRGPYCAKAVFSPDSNTLKLRKGKSGQVGIYAKAQDGGRASGARWTLLGQENANFSPSSSQDAGPSISYTVTNAPQNGFVKVTVKFTSTAGVGEDTWTQPTDKGPTINQIAGTFSLRSDIMGSALEWAGNVTFDRFSPAIFGGASGFFKFKEGQLTATASGNGTLLSAPLCSQRGSGQIAFSSGSQFAVLGSGPEQLEPYQYSFSIASKNEPLPMITIELFNCAPVAEEQEGFYEYPVAFEMSGNGDSPDGITYSGSETKEQSGTTVTETWSFQGTE
ncbi:MAG TPA: hypothetical protein VIY71_09110 [Solirubrobacterales bacterium]